MDIRAALVVLPAGTAETVFLRMVHQAYRYTMSCVYTFVHEGYGPFRQFFSETSAITALALSFILFI